MLLDVLINQSLVSVMQDAGTLASFGLPNFQSIAGLEKLEVHRVGMNVNANYIGTAQRLIVRGFSEARVNSGV
jgi:hypothetical protein